LHNPEKSSILFTMKIASRLAVKSWAFFLFAPLIAASCATVVTFDVERLPLVDLRGAKTITVIPFERNSIREHTYLAQRVTAALMAGLRRGNITVVDPYSLGNTEGWTFSQYADVYITGRIVNINIYEQVESTDQAYGNQNMIRETIYGTATVDIEYSYISSANNKTLGYFRKSEIFSNSFERTRYRDQYANRNTNSDVNRETARDANRAAARETARRGAGLTNSLFPRRGTWQEGMAESAISQFTDAMVNELGAWTEIEERKIKGKTGDDQLAARANSLIEQHRYDEALVLYKTIFEKSGNIFAGYNAAILLAANGRFSAALELLERLRDKQLQEGKSIPPFIKKEIVKMAEYVGGYSKLETISPASPRPPVPPPPVPEPPSFKGSVNMLQGTVYALNGQIASVDDNSIFPKMVAYADVRDGQWSMRLPNAAPATVWLLITDHREYYITNTAVKFSDTITLNKETMTKLR